MPKPSSHQRNGSLTPSDPEKVEVEENSILSHAIQPLLEQEALLESFIEQASSQRKFEDVKSLKTNLAEIKAEISKMVKNSRITTNGNNVANGKK